MTGPALGEALRAARRVADAVLYEGYVLFPYRASAAKNRYRWQFGVVIPATQEGAGTAEPSHVTSQCLLRAGPAARVTVTARFLTLRRRQVHEAAGGRYVPVDELDVDGQLHASWDEGVEREVVAGPATIDGLAGHGLDVPFTLDGEAGVETLRDASGAEAGRVERRAEAVSGVVRLRARRLDGDVVRLETLVRNVTGWAEPGAGRDEVLRRSLVGLHLLLAAEDATFASLVDPPRWAAPWVAGLDNQHTHPVLCGTQGRDDVVLSAPIILPDHPEIAPESAGDAYDATEIDELLTLAVRALTDEEKRQARATDPRAAEVVARADTLPPEVLERLHGAVRQFAPVTGEHGAPGEAGAGDHGAPPEVEAREHALDEQLAEFFGVGEAPAASVEVEGRTLAVGDRVRLAPRRRADAQDLFAAGRVARLEAIETDLEGEVHLAVTLEDDPGADLHSWSRRFMYFRPDEVEALDSGGEHDG